MIYLLQITFINWTRNYCLFRIVNLQLESSWDGIEQDSLEPPVRFFEVSLFLSSARKPLRFCLFCFLGVWGDPGGRGVDSSTEKWTKIMQIYTVLHKDEWNIEAESWNFLIKYKFSTRFHKFTVCTMALWGNLGIKYSIKSTLIK